MYITEENKSKTIEHLNKELSKILEEKEISKDTLHCIYEIVDVLKDLSEIDEKEMESGYSQGTRYDHRMMGRNSYDNYRNSYGNSYNSYGTDRDRMMDQWMSQASNDRERDLVRRIMNSI